MLPLTSMELGKVSLKVEDREEALVTLSTAVISTAFNIAAGFLAGLPLHTAMKRGS